MISTPPHLIRYLFVCKVNSSLVWLPASPAVELSVIMATTIAKRLPSVQARHWHKALKSWDVCGPVRFGSKKSLKRFPDSSFPIESVLFFYPGKQNYGSGELILWELKLMGEYADHGFFLEIILPALEEISSMTNPQWKYTNCLWGHFDIHGVYVARGRHWEPLVKDSQLDLTSNVSPVQWAEGMLSDIDTRQDMNCLKWLTPVDFGSHDTSKSAHEDISLTHILKALIARMNSLIPGGHCHSDDLPDQLPAEEKDRLQKALEQSALVSASTNKLTPNENGPGCWTGSHTFTPVIPREVLPYLELASVLHVGKYTHFGCGTFLIV